MLRKVLGRLGVIPGTALLIFALIASGLLLTKYGFFGVPTPGEQTTGAAEVIAFPAESPLAVFAREREQLRAARRTQLNEILYSSDKDAETSTTARVQLLRLGEWEEAERTIEGVLRSRGYANCICTVHDRSVNVLLAVKSLTREESALIYDLVLRETGISGENVKIIPVQ